MKPEFLLVASLSLAGADKGEDQSIVPTSERGGSEQYAWPTPREIRLEERAIREQIDLYFLNDGRSVEAVKPADVPVVESVRRDKLWQIINDVSDRVAMNCGVDLKPIEKGVVFHYDKFSCDTDLEVVCPPDVSEPVCEVRKRFAMYDCFETERHMPPHLDFVSRSFVLEESPMTEEETRALSLCVSNIQPKLDCDIQRPTVYGPDFLVVSCVE